MSVYTEAVYQILVEECDADPYYIHMFNRVWPDCNEFRFIGNQGFGGKVWVGTNSYGGRFEETPAYVTNYPEDDNSVRKAARDRANERLARLDM